MGPVQIARGHVRPIVCAIALAASAASCTDSAPGPVWVLTANAPTVDLRRAKWQPSDAIRVARRGGEGRLELEVRPGFRGRVHIEVPGACPAEESFDGARALAKSTEIAPRVRIPEWLADVGYDRDVEISAVAGCASAPEITWRVVTGDAPLTVLDNGLRARTRTPAFARALEPAKPSLPTWGIVPISPRTQGAIELEARYVDGGDAIAQRVRITAAPRATGIPTVAAGGRVYLFDEGWTVLADLRGRKPTLTPRGGFTEVDTHEAGRFVLADASGRRLGIRIGRHDEMPLDCARSDCHHEIGRTIDASPMTHVFERGMTGALGEYAPRCAVACHTLGEPGADDGGFVHLARVLPARVPSGADPAWFAEMPRDLRRTSGVGCMACHGPAAIPEPGARWSVLRATVCATCHDAPPKYGHVVAWQSSRMAVADRAPETRQGECASCHTTGGFLSAIGARPGLEVPADAGAFGIACAACHSPHARDAVGPLVRKVPVPPSLGAPDVGTSAVCLSCHGARDGATPADLPRASAARLVFAPGPHRAARGCLACHGTPHDPSSEAHGAGHSFKADPASCRHCHDAGANLTERADPRGTIAERADALWRALVRAGAVLAAPGATPHAATQFAVSPSAPAPLADAARKVALVREDPAAGVHNAPRARALLDEAEALIGRR